MRVKYDTILDELREDDSYSQGTIVEALKNTVNIYGESSVNYDEEVTLATYTVPTGYTFGFTGATIGGNADGEFSLKVNGGTVAKARNTAAVRTLSVVLWNHPKVNAGGIVSVTVKNVSYRKGTRLFETNLNGFKIDIA